MHSITGEDCPPGSSLIQADSFLWSLDCLLYWDYVPRVLNPPTPFSRERSGPTGFSSPHGFPCPPTPARHLRTCLNPPNPMFFIGTLSQTLTLRAAFSSSTYLLSQIPGPGRSSDDDFLNHSTPPIQGAHQASVRTRARGHRFAILRPASDDALLHLWTVLFRLLLHVSFLSALSDWPLCFGVVLSTAVTSL